jgi:hypothetical protein
MERLSGHDSAAKDLLAAGGTPPDTAESGLAERAAWTVLANVLLNLDEALTK